jgi:hypothetical protein
MTIDRPDLAMPRIAAGTHRGLFVRTEASFPEPPDFGQELALHRDHLGSDGVDPQL